MPDLVKLMQEMDDFLYKTEWEHLKASKSIENFNNLFNIEIY